VGLPFQKPESATRETAGDGLLFEPRAGEEGIAPQFHFSSVNILQD
jgi:hypothetical protein